MRRFIAIVTAILAFFSLFLILRAADSGQIPPFITQLYSFPNGDKVGHFLLMGSVAFLLVMALPVPWRLRGLVFLAGVLTLEEISQLFFITRSFSLVDLACSLAGVGLFGYFSIRLDQIFDLKEKAKQYGTKRNRT
jgi:hypothetical protein